MPTWSTILTAVLTAVLTLIATTITTYFLNSPKRWKERREKELSEEKARYNEELENYKQEVNSMLKVIREEHLQEKSTDERGYSAVLEKLDEIKKENKLQSMGLQTVIRNDLKVHYLKWINEGYAPLDAQRDCEDMYQVYHKLGSNGVMDKLREEFRALPTAKSKRKDSENIIEGGNKN